VHAVAKFTLNETFIHVHYSFSAAFFKHVYVNAKYEKNEKKQNAIFSYELRYLEKIL
jgi:hypothetical protein